MKEFNPDAFQSDNEGSMLKFAAPKKYFYSDAFSDVTSLDDFTYPYSAKSFQRNELFFDNSPDGSPILLHTNNQVPVLEEGETRSSKNMKTQISSHCFYPLIYQADDVYGSFEGKVLNGSGEVSTSLVFAPEKEPIMRPNVPKPIFRIEKIQPEIRKPELYKKKYFKLTTCVTNSTRKEKVRRYLAKRRARLHRKYNPAPIAMP